MKAMIMSDLLIAKKYLLQQLGVSIAVGIFITVVIGNLYVAAPMVGVMIPFSLTITILALDERANWQQFRLALPMSRSSPDWPSSWSCCPSRCPCSRGSA